MFFRPDFFLSAAEVMCRLVNRKHGQFSYNTERVHCPLVLALNSEEITDCFLNKGKETTATYFLCLSNARDDRSRSTYVTSI
jgi:hypothetical protein